MKKFFTCIILCLSVVGCATINNSKLSPVDKAAQTGVELSQYYKILYTQASSLTEYGTDEQKEFMLTKVNPVLNLIKRYLIEYNELVVSWKESGTQPDNVNDLANKIQNNIATAISLIAETNQVASKLKE